MNKSLAFMAALLVTLVLAACSPGINTFGGTITFDSSGMVVHARGQPDAHVARDGDLRIGDRAVATTPAQRQLLRQYYQQADVILHSGEAMGKQGVQMAARGIGDAIASIFHGDSSTAEKRMDADSQHIEAAADKMCTDIKVLDATQDEIAAQIPAFKPYASANRMQCEVTRTVTQAANGSTSAKFNFRLRKADGQGATANRASPQRVGGSSEPTPSTSSQP